MPMQWPLLRLNIRLSATVLLALLLLLAAGCATPLPPPEPVDCPRLAPVPPELTAPPIPSAFSTRLEAEFSELVKRLTPYLCVPRRSDPSQ